MGDLVRSVMETMVPDIVSLVKRKVFTKKEAKQILKAREAAEYAFLKKNASQKEYLKAIQYEYDLVSLHHAQPNA
jgi:U3 small nucleolar RNA-associated protein 6